MGSNSDSSILHEKISVGYLLGVFGLVSAFSTALSLLSVFPGGCGFLGGGARFSLPFPWSSAFF